MLTTTNLADWGWKITATNVWGGTPNATVEETVNYGGKGNFKFYTGPMNDSWIFQWAGLSTDVYAGMYLSNIVSVKIRNFGFSGDNIGNYQPPTFMWVVSKDGVNQRCISWKPWSNGNVRQPLVWHEYDAATTGTWHVYETGFNYTNLTDLKAALPHAYFELTANLPESLGYASLHAFNVGNCPIYDEDRAWFTATTGYLDWFEIGVRNGGTTNVTRYELGYIDPSLSIARLDATNVVVSWPEFATNFYLLGWTNLEAYSTTCSEVTNARTIIYNTVYVTNTVSSPSQFYRLSLTPTP